MADPTMNLAEGSPVPPTSLDLGVRRRLDKPLDAGRVKQRQGRGSGSLSYIEGHDAIRTANEIFGHGGWGTRIVEQALLGVEQATSSQGKPGHRVAYRCIVEVTVQGCPPVQGSGYGDATEYTGSALTCHELALKEAETDAMKRALVKFGDQFGLALYEKDAAARAEHVAQPAPAWAAPTGKVDELVRLLLEEGRPDAQIHQVIGKQKNANGHVKLTWVEEQIGRARSRLAEKAKEPNIAVDTTSDQARAEAEAAAEAAFANR